MRGGVPPLIVQPSDLTSPTQKTQNELIAAQLPTPLWLTQRHALSAARTRPQTRRSARLHARSPPRALHPSLRAGPLFISSWRNLLRLQSKKGALQFQTRVSSKSGRCERRGEAERETQSPPPPPLLILKNNTSLQLERVSFCPSPPRLPLERGADGGADTLTLCGETAAALCAPSFSTWTVPEQQQGSLHESVEHPDRCSRRAPSSSTRVAPLRRRLWRASPEAFRSWEKSSSLRSFGRGPSRPLPPRDPGA